MATRQVLPLIDLRGQAERQDPTGSQRSAQMIKTILQTLGQAEKVRRERQTLDRITRAISAGATDIEAIAAAAGGKPEFGTGFQGILQKLGGAFQPQGGGIGQGIQQMIIGEKLKQALAPKKPELLTDEERKELKLYGKRERPETAGIIEHKRRMEQVTYEKSLLDINIKKQNLRKAEHDYRTATSPEKKEKADIERERAKVDLETAKEELKAIKRGEKTNLQKLIEEGYTEEEARLIIDIKYGLEPRASSRKVYENMSDPEKMKFLTTLKRSAEGPYYKIEGGNTEPLEPRVAEWANKELQKLPMFKDAGFGNRPDGTPKGKGFLGTLQLKGGGVATEYSVGVELESKGGAETDIPTLVPTLTKSEIDLMINDIIPNQKSVPEEILQKAVDHANKRVREGKSVFAGEGEVLELDEETARQILMEAGGDKERARQIAKERGYKL